MEAGEGLYRLEGEGESVVVTIKWYQEKAIGHMGYWPGYYVVYTDGYVSWSPAKAFEEGYTKVPFQS